jgi:hypothetical protein
MYALLQICLDWGEDDLPPVAVLRIGAKKDLEAFLDAYRRRYVVANLEWEDWYADNKDVNDDTFQRKHEELEDRYQVLAVTFGLDELAFEIVDVLFDDDDDNEPVDAPAPRLPAMA